MKQCLYADGCMKEGGCEHGGELWCERNPPGSFRPPSLFQLGKFKLASGMESSYKIECDALTDDDWACLAYLLFQKLPPFGSCEGVPTGGLKLAQAMQKYCTPGATAVLIVDDVWTTGKSMINYMLERGIQGIGAVIFARGPVDRWVTPLFTM